MKNSKRIRSAMAKGISLVEILVVTSIIGILAAIVTPALSQAKRQAGEAVAIAHLRQSGLALLIYAEDCGGIPWMPVRPAADRVLSSAPTCDPRDYFRASCSAPSEPPLIGSFAYVRDELTFSDEAAWNFYLQTSEQRGKSAALLIDLFSSHKRHRPGAWFGEYLGNPIPDQIRVFEVDGGVRLRHPWNMPTVGYTWETLFFANK